MLTSPSPLHCHVLEQMMGPAGSSPGAYWGFPPVAAGMVMSGIFPACSAACRAASQAGGVNASGMGAGAGVGYCAAHSEDNE
jgi:hypothetical protein